jgi:hypothetical protein
VPAKRPLKKRTEDRARAARGEQALMPSVPAWSALIEPRRTGNTRSPSTGRITQLVPISPNPPFDADGREQASVACDVSPAICNGSEVEQLAQAERADGFRNGAQ